VIAELKKKSGLVILKKSSLADVLKNEHQLSIEFVILEYIGHG
jgi:hypothetical protein